MLNLNKRTNVNQESSLRNAHVCAYDCALNCHILDRSGEVKTLKLLFKNLIFLELNQLHSFTNIIEHHW